MIIEGPDDLFYGGGISCDNGKCSLSSSQKACQTHPAIDRHSWTVKQPGALTQDGKNRMRHRSHPSNPRPSRHSPRYRLVLISGIHYGAPSGPTKRGNGRWPCRFSSFLPKHVLFPIYRLIKRCFGRDTKAPNAFRRHKWLIGLGKLFFVGG